MTTCFYRKPCRWCLRKCAMRMLSGTCATAYQTLMPGASVQVPSYIQICGIILGMITIGYLGDRIGRKWGSVTTVSLMFVRPFPDISMLCM